MQGQNEGVVSRASVDWRLSFRSVCVHNAHVSGGKAISRGCDVCTYGLGGVMARIAPVEKPNKEDEVAKGDGDNKKESAAPSPSDWADYYGADDKVLEKG